MRIQFGDVTLTFADDFVAEVEMHRPPNNYFDFELVQSLVAAYARVDEDPAIRAIVLCSEGKHFCAGADLVSASSAAPVEAGHEVSLYREAVRLFSARTPVVAAVHGAAIGGGFGLACAADFRVAAPQARFAANFARIGFHHGIGLSTTLPRIVGQQAALDLLYTGRRISGQEAARIGLADHVVPLEDVRTFARSLASEIAASAPLAVRSIRHTMRSELAEAVARATEREESEQARLRETDDFAEGVRASAERRAPIFYGR